MSNSIIFGMKKTKVSIQILLVISLIFLVAITNSENVQAQEIQPVQETQKYCCLQDINGNTCQQYESQGNCVEGTEFPGSCSNYAPCKPICCDLTGTEQQNYQDIGCYTNVGSQTCTDLGGELKIDGNCGYEQCNVACCKVGTQCALSTKKGCEKITSDYNLEIEYNPEITTQTECNNLCNAEQIGCCVTSGEDQNQCKSKTSAECQVNNGEFYVSTLCSSIRDKCAQYIPKSKLGCKEGDYKVYWYDSGGNIEGEAAPQDTQGYSALNIPPLTENCDYAKGTICREGLYTDKFGKPQAGCANVNCFNTEENKNVIWDNPRVDENGDCNENSLSTDSCWTNDDYTEDNPRKNGESWCGYLGNAGPGMDLPGSKHYLHSCINGQEQIQSCVDYRESICLQSKLVDNSGKPIMTTANCIPNKAEDCTSQKTKYDCENAQARICLWSAPHGWMDTVNKILDEYKKADKDSVLKDYGSLIQEEKDKTEKNGICIPLVPLGTQFWDSESDAKIICDAGDSKKSGIIKPVKTVWASGSETLDYEWDCEGGCGAFTKTFSYSMNDMCNMLGDCGAGYNLAAAWTKEGFKRTFNVDGKFDLDDPGDVEHNIIKEYDYEDIQGFDDIAKGGQCELGNGDDCTRALIRAGKKSNTLKNDKVGDPRIFRSFSGLYKNYRGSLLLSDISLGSESLTGEKFGVVGFGLSLGAVEGLIVVLAGGGLLPLLISALGVGLIAVAILYFTSWPEKKTAQVKINCDPWQAPAGTENCKLCQEPGEIKYLVSSEKECNGEYDSDKNMCTGTIDLTSGGRYECTRYLCNSLGAGCSYIETEQGKKCLDTQCSGTEGLTPPYISPKTDIITTDLKDMCRKNDQDTSDIKKCSTSDIKGQIGGGVFEIKDAVKANTDLSITLQTCKDENCNEPMYSICKWDTEKKENFDDMENDFVEIGDSYTHTLQLGAGIDLISKNDETVSKNIYVQCRNRCGYPEEGRPYPVYEIKLKIARAKDIEPVEIKEINPQNGGLVPNNKLNNLLNPFDVEFIPNKVVEDCRYDITNIAYDSMQTTNPISCDLNSITRKQECAISLPNLKEGDNIIYIKCEGKNNVKNTQSIPENRGYKLIGTKPLNIDYVKCLQGDAICGESYNPSAVFDIYGTNFTLQTSTTEGSELGKSVCKMTSWAMSPEFLNTNTQVHTQLITRPTENSILEKFECIDSAGNIAKGNFTYTLTIDRKKPVITKVYIQQGTLYVETNENSICKYNTAFGNINYNGERTLTFERTGQTLHSTSINQDNYFKVICKDMNDNDQIADIYLKD